MPRLALLVLACCFAVLAAPARGAQATLATQFQIESDLTCQCGCGLTVHSCNHLNCSSGIPLKKEIAAQIEAGLSREEILSHFEKKYGEKILAAPTTRGFNLAAWIVPFVAIGVGGLIIGVVLTRWRRSTSGRAEAPEVRAAPSTADPAQRARLESALEDFERRS